MTRRKSPLVIDMPPPQESMSAPVAPIAAWLDDALAYGTGALLMVAVLAFGATEPWGQFLQRSLALVLFGLWVARQYSQGSIELPRNPLYLPTVAFVGLIVFQFVTGRTGYRYATLTGTLNLIPCGVLLLVTGGMFTRRRRLRQFVMAMAIFGFGVALFALIQDLSDSDKIYWVVKAHGFSAAIYGPYANHNHYAGLMEMLIPLAGAAAFLERGGKRGLLLFAAIMMTVSVVLSRSRGGMLGLGVAMVFLCAVLYRTHRQHRTVLTVFAISAAVTVLVVFLGNDKVLQHLTETQDHYRLAIYSDCIRMWLHKPLLGFGYGTFPTVYPEYRSFFTNLLVNHAHNDYLELLVETGLVGTLIAGWFLFGVFREGLRRVFDQKDREGSILDLGVLTGLVALLAHSALDFNLHIAANAALFYTLCSAAATPFKHRVRQLSFAQFENEEDEPLMVNSPA